MVVSDPVPPRWPVTFLTSCQARQMWTTHCVRNVLTPCWITWTRNSTSQRMNARITSELVHNKEPLHSKCLLTSSMCVYYVIITHCMWTYFRQCLELLSHLQVEGEDTLLAELHHLKEEEEALVQELEAVEEQRAAVAQELTQSRIHSQQLDTEELQWVTQGWCKHATMGAIC